MSFDPISRRGFFARLVGLGIPTASRPVVQPAVPPDRAWVIVELDWEEIDGSTYPTGESTHQRLFYDHAAAAGKCRRLCDAFFAARTPAEFQIDCWAYSCEETVTWAELCEAGFSDPYYIHQLNTTPEDIDS